MQSGVLNIEMNFYGDQSETTNFSCLERFVALENLMLKNSMKLWIPWIWKKAISNRYQNVFDAIDSSASDILSRLFFGLWITICDKSIILFFLAHFPWYKFSHKFNISRHIQNTFLLRRQDFVSDFSHFFSVLRTAFIV